MSAFVFTSSGPLPPLKLAGSVSPVSGAKIALLEAAMCLTCSANVRTPL